MKKSLGNNLEIGVADEVVGCASDDNSEVGGCCLNRLQDPSCSYNCAAIGGVESNILEKVIKPDDAISPGSGDVHHHKDVQVLSMLVVQNVTLTILCCQTNTI